MKELEYIYNTAFSEIVELTNHRDVIEKFILKSADSRDPSRVFVRSTKLSPSSLLTFMIMPRTESSQSELEMFYGELGIKPPTKSAFSISRKRISPELFQFLNNRILDNYYREMPVKKWKNKFIIGVDGTTLTMPRGSRFEPLYGYATSPQDKSIRVPTARAVVLTDVLNKQILDIRLDSYASYEPDIAYEAIKALPEYIKENAIFIFDRLYISNWFLTVLQDMDIQYVMRCRHNFSNCIEEFWKSGQSHTDALISISRAAWSAKTKSHFVKAGITQDKYRPLYVHLTKSMLPNGDSEVICSRVFGTAISAARAYHLYGLRWKAETAIGIEKNEWQIEIFSGYSKIAILQDIYCKMISYNLCSITIVEANKKLEVNKTAHAKKFDATHKVNKIGTKQYQVNINMALFNFKYMIIRFYNRKKKPHTILSTFIRIISHYYEPVIPNRSYPRNFRSYKTKGKYASYTNYARAI